MKSAPFNREQAMSKAPEPAVYILASSRHGTLYTGVTGNLISRVWLHRHDVVDGFSRQHQTHALVWYEQHATMIAAITREKQLKKWHRAWKVRLIEEANPAWKDLWPQLLGGCDRITPRGDETSAEQGLS